MIDIVDYNAGNLTSVKRALDYLSIPCRITPDPGDIENAERVIFPGVGNAESAMKTLKDRKLDQALKKAFDKGTPILGICLGTQIILSYSEEGDTDCLGLIDGKTILFRLKDRLLKIPHMGWNSINIKQKHFILKDVKPGEEFYFVHSFYPQPADASMVIASSSYEIDFPSAIGYKNLIASQFHPEKSGPAGLQILKNFSVWDGTGC
jgi:imidazole glycerol-phosphate synthase subunit HisH